MNVLLQKAAELIKFPAELLRMLQTPERKVEVFLPVRMDSGSTEIFRGYRVQHNSWRGPYKGGIRYHPEAN
ncbi:MAG: Glu/Leu/Phe/Val dehydrogenase dimerization domain-containing protein, partial [Patescibacteria group bacterium]|nr:Glu/Leu/Phe/Val dehydrogenase dimerization domain-containing protein [Patescibacteria group bacterium]